MTATQRVAGTNRADEVVQVRVQRESEQRAYDRQLDMYILEK